MTSTDKSQPDEEPKAGQTQPGAPADHETPSKPDAIPEEDLEEVEEQPS